MSSFFSVLRLEMLRVSMTSDWGGDGWSTTIMLLLVEDLQERI